MYRYNNGERVLFLSNLVCMLSLRMDDEEKRRKVVTRRKRAVFAGNYDIG